jgi:hypothetical protein
MAEMHALTFIVAAFISLVITFATMNWSRLSARLERRSIHTQPQAIQHVVDEEILV